MPTGFSPALSLLICQTCHAHVTWLGYMLIARGMKPYMNSQAERPARLPAAARPASCRQPAEMPAVLKPRHESWPRRHAHAHACPAAFTSHAVATGAPFSFISFSPLRLLSLISALMLIAATIAAEPEDMSRAQLSPHRFSRRLSSHTKY